LEVKVLDSKSPTPEQMTDDLLAAVVSVIPHFFAEILELGAQALSYQ